MNDWHVLHLDGDPTPGDPTHTRALATRLLEQADLAGRNTSRLRAVATGSGDLRMEGDYASRFTDALATLPAELAKLQSAYRGCGEAVSAYATSLQEAKTKAGAALQQGSDADVRYQSALREIQALLPSQRAFVFSSGYGLSELAVQANTLGVDEVTKAQVRAAVARARLAQEDRDLARRLADQAKQLRGEAETRCEKGIRDALAGSGIQDREWYQKAWDVVSAPFRSWDDFVDLCKNVALVAGIAALLISGPIGWALAAAALVAGAAVFADTLTRYSRGEASLIDVLLDSLYLIPGSSGVVKLSGLAPAVLQAARQTVRGGGRLVGSALRSSRGTMRGSITDLRQSGRQFDGRVTYGDPIDVASGEVVLDQVDLELPGVLALLLSRTHVSSYQVGRLFGASWASTLDQRLEVDGSGVWYATGDGMLLAYPFPAADGSVLPEEGPRLPLARADDGGYTVTEPGRGHTLHFASVGDPDVLSLAAIADRNGHRIDLNYDAAGVLAQVRHSGGYIVEVDTQRGRVIALRLRGAGGRGGGSGSQPLVRYGYDAAGLLSEVVNSSGKPVRFAYDNAGRLTGWEDANQSWFRYSYDGLGRCVGTSGSAGCLDGALSYDVHAGTTTVTNSLGEVTTYHLNDALQVVREVDPLGHATGSAWDRYDRLLARTDPLGRTTRYSYGPAGNLTATIRPDGRQRTATYNELGLAVTMVDYDGTTWRWDYDEGGNLTAQTDPAGATTSITYDQHGHAESVTNALGHTQRVQTDGAGLPLTVTTPLGATTRYIRDSFGRVTGVTDPLGNTTRFDHTVEGRLASRTMPDGATESWRYDGEGNLIEHVDAIGQSTRVEVSNFDLPAAQTGPDGARFAFSYDTELRLVAVTNPHGLVWRYAYDPAGNLVRETDFDDRVLVYRYDAAGQLIERVNGAGESTRYTHDLLGNVIEQHAGAAGATFQYDAVGRVVRATNADADVHLSRDQLGRIVGETCNDQTVASTCDRLGRRVLRRTPTGAQSAWEYDADEQLVSLTTAGHTMNFRYDSAGRELERRLDTGLSLTQSWDSSARLLSQEVAAPAPAPASAASTRMARLIERRSYTYRPDSHLTAIDDHTSGPRRFDLDPAGRVTAVHGAGWTEHYTYDHAGNITHARWPTAPQHAGAPRDEAQGDREYDGTLIRRAGRIRYEHDAQGRVILRQHKQLSAKPRTWRYHWDAEDRLTEVTTPDGHRWTYHYDPFGRRISKRRHNAQQDGHKVEQVDFAWDGVTLAEQTHTEPDRTATTRWEWQAGRFRPLLQVQRSVARHARSNGVEESSFLIVSDGIGTTFSMFDTRDFAPRQHRSTLWGMAEGEVPNEAQCQLQFPGQYADLETGLNYNLFRYYDPSVGRYVSCDPIGLEGGPNPSSYVDNPFTEADPIALMCSGPGRHRLAPPGTEKSEALKDLGTLGLKYAWQEAKSVFPFPALRRWKDRLYDDELGDVLRRLGLRDWAIIRRTILAGGALAASWVRFEGDAY